MAGSVKITSWQARERLSLLGVELVLPSHLGGHTVFKASSIGTSASVWTVLTGADEVSHGCYILPDFPCGHMPQSILCHG